ncbi:MAG: hypothetical protein J5U19_14375, partial [Candidatus Methanoperedens sp.]|nr:hypothetical protein [Candidatus Methanoperedens sp.]
GSLCSPDMTVRVLAYPSQPTFNNSVEAPFMYRVQLSYIREFLRGEAWPKLVEEGRIKMKNGKPILIREGIEQTQTGGVTVTQALRDAFE